MLRNRTPCLRSIQDTPLIDIHVVNLKKAVRTNTKKQKENKRPKTRQQFVETGNFILNINVKPLNSQTSNTRNNSKLEIKHMKTT